MLNAECVMKRENSGSRRYVVISGRHNFVIVMFCFGIIGVYTKGGKKI
jgi:hypothetical protein